MKSVSTIGLDVAKDVFQVHGADADGGTVFNRKLRRAELLGFFENLPRCLVGLEACSTAHHWAQRITELGHDVRLIHANYVKPFVKRGKTDANDAEAINEALTRRTMRFVPMKTDESRASAMMFRTRTMLVRQKTQTINALRSHLAEFGIVAGRGESQFKKMVEILSGESDIGIPPTARFPLLQLVAHVEDLNRQLADLGREILRRLKADDDIERLMTIPGVGPISAVAIKSLVPDPGVFKSAGHFAAWIGLTPKSHSSGSTHVLGRISKMGNPQLRALLVTGAMSVLRGAATKQDVTPWLSRLRSRRPFKVAAVALANKTARIIWALLVKGGRYVRPDTIAASPEAACAPA